MTEWFLYFLSCKGTKRAFRNYEHFLEWLAEANND
jgi:hypothetical protein